MTLVYLRRAFRDWHSHQELNCNRESIAPLNVVTGNAHAAACSVDPMALRNGSDIELLDLKMEVSPENKMSTETQKIQSDTEATACLGGRIHCFLMMQLTVLQAPNHRMKHRVGKKKDVETRKG